MRMWGGRILLLGVLVLASGIFSPNSAGATTGPFEVYFPWVPNGAMLGGMGPFTGAVTIQNLEGEAISISFGPWVLGSLAGSEQLEAYGSVTLSAERIGVPSPGSAVRVWGTKLSGGDARISGVLKQTAPVAPHLPVQEARTSNSHQTVDGYTGLDTSQLGSARYVLPIVQTNSGWNTKIRVVNLDGIAADVTVTLNPAGGGTPILLALQVAPASVGTFDLLDLNVGQGFVGSAAITTNPDIKFAAIAERYKASTNMLIVNPALRREACTTTHYAPLVFDNYHHWNTGISVTNLGNAVNNVTISYFATNGAPAGSTMLAIPPSGMNYVYTPASGAGVGFLGAAVIEGTELLCAVVDEVKYTGDQPDVGHAMSYPTRAETAYAGQALALPLAQRGTPSTGHGDTTGIQVFNVRDNHNVVVEVYIYDQQGTLITVVQANIPARGSATFYFPGLAVPDGFQGSAVVEVISGIGWITGVSNNVNYAVQFDGSASYSLLVRP